jgi:hypothetical protein
MMCGDQIFVGMRDALLGGTLREVRNEGRLQQVTIEEHQVGDLVFVLLHYLYMSLTVTLTG